MIWNREWNGLNRHERDYQHQNIKDKESYRWIVGAQNTKTLYSQRWFIEELYRVLKSKGLLIESAQLETGSALKKLAVIALQVALTTMTLKLSLSSDQKIESNLIFTKEQLHFLQLYMKKLEGKTKKLSNPYEKGTLQWAAWGIARIGGWSGYTSQGPPGYITIKDGLDRFFEKYDGFQLALNIFSKDV